MIVRDPMIVYLVKGYDACSSEWNDDEHIFENRNQAEIFARGELQRMIDDCSWDVEIGSRVDKHTPKILDIWAHDMYYYIIEKEVL